MCASSADSSSHCDSFKLARNNVMVEAGKERQVSTGTMTEDLVSMIKALQRLVTCIGQVNSRCTPVMLSGSSRQIIWSLAASDDRRPERIAFPQSNPQLRLVPGPSTCLTIEGQGLLRIICLDFQHKKNHYYYALYTDIE